jgi:Lantibiotic dehydratase, N terminus
MTTTLPSETSVPDHAVRLPGDNWLIWRCVGLRGAGFNASEVLNLASRSCAQSADELLQAESDLRRAQSQALDALRRELNSADETRRAMVDKMLRRVKKGKAPELPAEGGVALTEIAAFQSAGIECERARNAFQAAFDAARIEHSESLRRAVSSARLREAIIWQNRRAFHTGVNVLLRRPAGDTSRPSKQRQHEELIANYLQRYCTKNDTIGFFGPVGWARIVTDGAPIAVKVGEPFLSSRGTYFESWCIDALISVIAQDKALRPWVAPRRNPFIYVEGNTLYVPMKAPATLPAAQAALLQACDGRRPAREIAAEIRGAFPQELQTEAAVYGRLDALCSAGLIIWTLEVPYDPQPEQALMRLLETIEDEDLRARCLAPVITFEAARQAVADAAGDPLKLDAALGHLEETFTQLTNMAATKDAGKMYAGRTLIYEDTQRNIDLKIGPQLLETLGPPLSLMLRSARWFTYETATRYRKVLERLYAEMVRETGSRTIDGILYWMRAERVLFGSGNRPVDDIQAEFQDRWADIFSIPPDQRQVNYRAEELRERVLHDFDAPRPGWNSARYHSPDIMIAASSLQAIERDEYDLVMGELHMGVNTLGISFFLEQHPAREELFRAVERDIPESRIIAVAPKYGGSSTARTHIRLLSDRDFRLEFALSSCAPRKATPLQIGALVVERGEHGLVARTRDRQRQFDIVEAFADILTGLSTNGFKMFRPRKHQPRVTVDRLVVSRESWSFSPSEMEFAFEKNDASRFVAARHWAYRKGMPRFVYVKSPVEIKPVYMDFDSPIYVDILAKIIRRTQETGATDALIAVSEMLPDLDHIWLPDAEGNRYTSEFRIVAIDAFS